MLKPNTIYCGDCLELLPEIEDDSIDCVVTDPPYGLKFMGKDWDKAVPSVDIWKEVLRVLKPGAFAAILCTPRQDCQARMIMNLEQAGFVTGFSSLLWTYATGFPKAGNLSKLVDKRAIVDCSDCNGSGVVSVPTGFHLGLCENHPEGGTWTAIDLDELEDLSDLCCSDCGDSIVETKEQTILNPCDHCKGSGKVKGAKRKVVGDNPNHRPVSGVNYKGVYQGGNTGAPKITEPSTPEAKALEGAYAGCQPKPAFEPVLIVMKPLTEKTYLDQALDNGKGCTWLDDCRIPTGDELIPCFDASRTDRFIDRQPTTIKRTGETRSNGRFPANVLCSGDCLNDGRVTQRKLRAENERSDKRSNRGQSVFFDGRHDPSNSHADSGSYSRYFDLDKWWADRVASLPEEVQKVFPWLIVPKAAKKEKGKNNKHPTVKPVKLLSYLVTLFSRPDDLVLDPFGGSGTTGLACQVLDRNFILIEKEEEYCQICCDRLDLDEWEY